MIEIAASILSGVIVLSSVLAFATKLTHHIQRLGRQRYRNSSRNDYNSIRGSVPRHERVDTIRAQMKDKYRKEQTELVAKIVWKYSQVPLKDALKDEASRNIIYESLSNPDQIFRDTNDSDHTK